MASTRVRRFMCTLCSSDDGNPKMLRVYSLEIQLLQNCARISVLQLLINRPVERRRVRTRWGWVVLSLGLMGLAGYFLYPSVESLTESQAVLPSAPPIPAPDKAASLPVAEPVARPPIRAAKTVAGTMVPAEPIREVAPVAADSIRNRIEDEIPVYVTLRIGPNGSVVGAEAAKADDGIQSYLVQRSLEAARQWKFRPARLGADAVPSKFTVRFLFDKSGVQWN